MRVGVIGLGVMGRPMAANLMRAGFPVAVYARRAASAASLVADGATACDSPAALAARQPVRDGDALTIPLGDYAELERILAEVRQSGESVLELDVVQPDLQDVFLQVMTRS